MNSCDVVPTKELICFDDLTVDFAGIITAGLLDLVNSHKTLGDLELLFSSEDDLFSFDIEIVDAIDFEYKGVKIRYFNENNGKIEPLYKDKAISLFEKANKLSGKTELYKDIQISFDISREFVLESKLGKKKLVMVSLVKLINPNKSTIKALRESKNIIFAKEESFNQSSKSMEVIAAKAGGIGKHIVDLKKVQVLRK